MNRKCDICNIQKEGATTCVIFIPSEDYCHPFNHTGINLFVCVECNMCYLSQYFEMTNREITEWFNWINKSWKEIK